MTCTHGLQPLNGSPPQDPPPTVTTGKEHSLKPHLPGHHAPHTSVLPGIRVEPWSPGAPCGGGCPPAPGPAGTHRGRGWAEHRELQPSWTVRACPSCRPWEQEVSH